MILLQQNKKGRGPGKKCHARNYDAQQASKALKITHIMCRLSRLLPKIFSFFFCCGNKIHSELWMCSQQAAIVISLLLILSILQATCAFLIPPSMPVLKTFLAPGASAAVCHTHFSLLKRTAFSTICKDASSGKREKRDPFDVPRPDPSILVSARPAKEQQQVFFAALAVVSAGTALAVQLLSGIEELLPYGWFAAWRDYTWPVPLGETFLACFLF
jgi:hypothetical protein